jgi:hypothetical protein
MTTKPDAALAAAKSIAVQVATEDGRTPLERVLARHWPMVSTWREAGWTWRQIASLLTRGGVRLRNGDPLTERYLAAVASRVNRLLADTVVQRSTVLADQAAKVDGARAVNRPPRGTSVQKTLVFEPPKPPDGPHLSVGGERREEIRERMRRASKSRSGN